uniref:Putative c2h2-type zn-finger protein n=1 Tax=Lutzomyia longipalpis TaxID=7200 RepID=A0A1B0C943_LUTLO
MKPWNHAYMKQKIQNIDQEFWRVFVLGHPPTDPKKNTFPCDSPGCGKMFSSRAALKKHTYIHGPRRHVCGRCGSAFKEKSKLKRHNLVHTKEKPFLCNHIGCGKRFSLEFNLRTHKLIHSGERPYRCPLLECTKAFTQSANLKAHIRSHIRRQALMDDTKKQSEPSRLKSHPKNLQYNIQFK